MKIAYLSSTVTLPGSPTRRPDAGEHDEIMSVLRPPFAEKGMSLHDIAWNDPDANWADYDAALIGTTWDYWDHHAAFVAALAQIEAVTPLYNSSALVRWNSHKGYLRDLEAAGVDLIPTLWIKQVTAQNAAAAFDTLGSETLVFKRQVGAGADGQHLLARHDAVPSMPHAMMVQPFLPMIQTEGELSFVFIDGKFCHALIKRAKDGDYRIQSIHGGVEEAVVPRTSDLCTARAVLAALDEVPLYARVDMLRSEEGGLLLMELELIEPYLYPRQGPELGRLLAAAMAGRLG